MNTSRIKAEQAKAIGKNLQLAPIPTEGGYFRRTFTAPQSVDLPDQLGGGKRDILSCIYFMLYRDFNAMHRMSVHEVWCYHGGGTLNLHELHDDGTLLTHKLGNVLDQPGNTPQVVIQAGNWMAAELQDSDDYVLVTCNVVPGFDPDSYRFANLKDMITRYPQHEALFRRVIRVKDGTGETDLDYQSPPLADLRLPDAG